MPSATIEGHISAGHSSFPPTPSIESSEDVIINGKGLVRVGDAFQPHGSPSPSPPHDRALSSGSSKVVVNGQDAGRIGDSLDDGDTVAQGSENVIIGG